LKFPPFEYLAPRDLGEALEALVGDEDAKVLAGGQSLLPLMALRLARPSLLIDLDRLDLGGVALEGGVLRLGAMTRQSTLEEDPSVLEAAPLVADAVRHVGHRSTRTRGSIGGSLAHADPAAELPAVMVALGASVVATSPAGQRTIPCRDLASSFFTTCLDQGEVLTEILIPAAPPGSGWAWCEWAPRSGDFADAGGGVASRRSSEGTCLSVGVAACGVGSVPIDLSPVLLPLLAGIDRPSPALIREVAAVVERECSSELAGLLAARSVYRSFAPRPGREEAAA
jgi:CO/xanthine dehydrogenase FAD-binding subunit